MLIIKTSCECGKEIDIDFNVGRQRHAKINGNDILYTSITLFTPMTCPCCGKNLGYLGTKVEPEC